MEGSREIHHHYVTNSGTIVVQQLCYVCDRQRNFPFYYRGHTVCGFYPAVHLT